jgi:biotin transporter BioY
VPLTKAALGSLWFVPGDIVKAVVAASVAVTVRRTAVLGEFPVG